VVFPSLENRYPYSLNCMKLSQIHKASSRPSTIQITHIGLGTREMLVASGRKAVINICEPADRHRKIDKSISSKWTCGHLLAAAPPISSIYAMT
jgi:hypothetical protein